MTSAGRTIDVPSVGRYRIEPEASEITLSAKHLFGLATVRAQMTIVSGEFVVADDLGASQATVTASATSFDSGDPRRDRAVAAAKFLDVQRYPSMHFASTAITRENEQWIVAGVLTAHGVEAPLRLALGEIESDGTGLAIRATGRVDRYEHGITAARGLAGRTIDVRISARAVRQASTD